MVGGGCIICRQILTYSNGIPVAQQSGDRTLSLAFTSFDVHSCVPKIIDLVTDFYSIASTIAPIQAILLDNPDDAPDHCADAAMCGLHV